MQNLVELLLAKKTCMAAEPSYLCRGKRIETPSIRPTLRFLFKKSKTFGGCEKITLFFIKIVDKIHFFCYHIFVDLKNL